MILEGSFIENALESGTWTNLPTIDHLPDDPGYSYLTEAGLRSQVLAPLTSNDAVIGVVAVSSTQLHAFGHREQAILERLASQITPAVENARLYKEAQDRNLEIQRLNESTTRILESNPSALVVMRGEDREVVTVNSSFCSGFNLDKDQIEGQPLLQVLDWADIEEWISESLSSSSGEGQREMKYTDPDGNERWFLVYAVPLQVDDDTDHEEEVLLVLNDVTEQKQQQERLQGHSRLASVGELAAGVAHEINNPLAAVLGLSELIQMENASASVTEDARKIQEAAERAAKIVQNLLSFARKQEAAKGYLQIASVVDRAIELKSHDFRLNNINVTTRHSDQVPLTMIDELQMIQVVLNILNNASQAIMENQRSGEITATTQLLDGKIRISITDDGPGIAPEILQNIFDPFFTTKQVGQGTGLGLSICYGIVREHGGELWVESKPGEGATFHIELPLASDMTHAGDRDVSADASSGPGSGSGRRILVVDDEPLFRDAMSRMLTADGHDVVLASNGYEAWDLIQKDRFELILADLRMPGLDGQRLYNLVKEKYQDVAEKMVFVTGDTASPTARNFLGATGNPVLSKPFTIDDVRRLIDSLGESGN
jgi:two-component system NtrC family sensor kinase